MSILGHGIDIVETARMKRMVEEHGQRFLDRVFTSAEQAYCSANPKRYYEHLAGRFAAKEAVLKEPSGQPRIRLTGECLRIATDLGISSWHLSLSHIETHATASAIGLRQER
jgi:holo-[acyl-carrier protein] synthase